MDATDSSTSPTQSVSKRLLFPYLLLTALICGALIMVVEVLGSRVIGPFFGVSLFIWTSLIAVTLIALSLGYAIGGVLSDRYGNPDALYIIIFAAGMLVLAIPLVKESVLTLTVPLGLRLGSFISATLLFGPPLFLLGCVSPYLIKIAAREMNSLGRTVGGFYALSTVGSVVGTALTGFVLIAYLGVDRIFQVVGGLLIALAVIYFVLLRKRWLAAPLMLVAFVVSPTDQNTEISRRLANGTTTHLVALHDSHYGNLKVIDYRYGAKHTRELVIDGLVQGGIDMTNGQSIYEYAYFLKHLPTAFHPTGTRCLVIGLGAGIVPRWYESRGIITDVVDIDPAVIDFAKRYFAFQPQGDTVIADARYFLRVNQKTYDYVILDVFTGDTTPSHLLSLEALRLVAGQLKPRGVVGINLVGSIGRDTYMTASVVRTLEQIFDQVQIYAAFDPGDNASAGAGNLALIAYQGERRQPDFRSYQARDVHPRARSIVNRQLTRSYRFPPDTPAIVLTDDYNPVDFYDAWLRERLRKNIIETTNWEILIKSS